MFIIINMIVTMMLTTVASFILYSTFYIFIKNSDKERNFVNNNNNNNIEQIRLDYESNPDRNRVLMIYDYYGNINRITIDELLKNNKDKIDYSDILDEITETKIAKEDLENCCISLERIKKGDEIRLLNCKHYFLKKYIDIWLKHNPSCPLCRKNITD
jgi:hypothetical protein